MRRVRGARGEGCGLRGQGAAGAAQASSLSRGRTGGRAARGVPGSSETAISETARPCERMRSDERAERPQSVTSDLQPGDVLETSSTALQSITGQSDSTSSTCSGSTGGEAVRGAETVHGGQLWQARQWVKACWLNETTGSKWSTRICDLLIKDNETRMNAEFKRVRQNTTQKKRRAREREEAPDDHQAHLDERRGGPRQYKRVRTRPSFPIPHYLSLIALSHCTSLPHSAPRRTPTPRSRPRPHPSRSGAPSTMINWSISSSAECFRKPLLI